MSESLITTTEFGFAYPDISAWTAEELLAEAHTHRDTKPHATLHFAHHAYRVAEKPSAVAFSAAELALQAVQKAGLERALANAWEMRAAAALPPEAYREIPAKYLG